LKASQKLCTLAASCRPYDELKVRDIATDAAVALISSPLERVGATAIDALTFLKDLQASRAYYLSENRIDELLI